MTQLAKIQEHWNEQAAKGETAGTQDLILKQLEQRALLSAIGERQVSTALEIGCGLGETARLVVQTFPRIDLLAVDNAAEMIVQARRAPHPSSRLRFKEADVLSLPPSGRFDLIYTQRCLINLPTWELQAQALEDIAARLVPGGRYLMCEHSQDGLDAINRTRVSLGLSVIERPWHNRYFRQQELATVKCLKLLRCEPFSATYYFLSRIVNAKLSDYVGQTPKYDAPINRLAVNLPAEGPWAQGRLWIWEKSL